MRFEDELDALIDEAFILRMSASEIAEILERKAEELRRDDDDRGYHG
jgi:hypothetical protein